MIKTFSRHFAVAHPLGMHARVCSKWVQTLQTARPAASGSEEWIWLVYKGIKIPADSLFKLLELRIPLGAEFDLIVDADSQWSDAIEQELETIIAHPSL